MEQPNATQPPRRTDRPGPDMVSLVNSVAASIRAGPGRLGDAQRCTVAEEALELAQWLGTGQALLARLQETYGIELLASDVLEDSAVALPIERYRLVGLLIRKAVEHFARMPLASANRTPRPRRPCAARLRRSR